MGNITLKLKFGNVVYLPDQARISDHFNYQLIKLLDIFSNTFHSLSYDVICINWRTRSDG
jgi:hypothetical protein